MAANSKPYSSQKNFKKNRPTLSQFFRHADGLLHDVWQASQTQPVEPEHEDIGGIGIAAPERTIVHLKGGSTWLGVALGAFGTTI